MRCKIFKRVPCIKKCGCCIFCKQYDKCEDFRKCYNNPELCNSMEKTRKKYLILQYKKQKKKGQKPYTKRRNEKWKRSQQ